MKKKVFRKVKVPRGYKSLFNQCWKLHSEIVRRTEQGICFTCGVRNDWKDTDCGHFRHGSLDFDRRNTHAQCKKCNLYLSGNLDNYALKLEAKYGQGILQELDKAKWQTLAPSYEDLITLKERLQAEILTLPMF